MKSKPNPSLPNSGPRDSKSKKATSKTGEASGVPGQPDSATTRGKDSSANEETKRSNSQPENWCRKVGSKHADAQAKKEQC